MDIRAGGRARRVSARSEARGVRHRLLILPRRRSTADGFARSHHQPRRRLCLCASKPPRPPHSRAVQILLRTSNCNNLRRRGSLYRSPLSDRSNARRRWTHPARRGRRCYLLLPHPGDAAVWRKVLLSDMRTSRPAAPSHGPVVRGRTSSFTGVRGEDGRSARRS